MADSNLDPLSLDRPIAGRYRVLRELGRGGMGAVYLVEHVHTGDELALKVLLANVGATPSAVERFKREARTSAAIKSEHVVKITDADVAPELGGAPFLVMERLNGADFDALVRERGPLSPELVVSYLSQVARAIDRAHQLGIVHRDLKPENLFLHHGADGEPMVKVLDFGVSKIVDPSGMRTSVGMTQTGVIMGTPLFMSPEQADLDSRVGPRADIWAVGLIAVFLLTGSIYWRSTTLSQLVMEIVASRMPPLSERFPERLPAAMDGWFRRSCHRDPEQRFATVYEQVDALAESLGVASPALLRRSPNLSDPAPTGTLLEVRLSSRTASTGNPLALSVVPSGAARRGRWLLLGGAAGALLVGTVLVWRGAETKRSSEPARPSAAAPAAQVPPVTATVAVSAPTLHDEAPLPRAASAGVASPPPASPPAPPPATAPPATAPPAAAPHATVPRRPVRPAPPKPSSDAAKPKPYSPLAP